MIAELIYINSRIQVLPLPKPVHPGLHVRPKRYCFTYKRMLQWVARGKSIPDKISDAV